jgi:hypothetical protein
MARRRSNTKVSGERGSSVYCVDTHAGKRCVIQSARTNDVRFVKHTNSRCPAACHSSKAPKRSGKKRWSDL